MSIDSAATPLATDVVCTLGFVILAGGGGGGGGGLQVVLGAVAFAWNKRPGLACPPRVMCESLLRILQPRNLARISLPAAHVSDV